MGGRREQEQQLSACQRPDAYSRPLCVRASPLRLGVGWGKRAESGHSRDASPLPRSPLSLSHTQRSVLRQTSKNQEIFSPFNLKKRGLQDLTHTNWSPL